MVEGVVEGVFRGLCKWRRCFFVDFLEFFFVVIGWLVWWIECGRLNGIGGSGYLFCFVICLYIYFFFLFVFYYFIESLIVWVVIVKVSSGLWYVVGCCNKVDKEKLVVGIWVVLDMIIFIIMWVFFWEVSFVMWFYGLICVVGNIVISR